MKKTATKKKLRAAANGLRREYRFDYRKATGNRFASRYKAGSLMVVIEPDIAETFTSPESVNAILRALIDKPDLLKKVRGKTPNR